MSSLSYNYAKAHLAEKRTPDDQDQQLLLNKQIELDAILIKLIHVSLFSPFLSHTSKYQTSVHNECVFFFLICLFQHNCNNNKSEKALDLSSTLHLKKSFEIAIKIATKANLAPLAQRIAKIAVSFSFVFHIQDHVKHRDNVTDVKSRFVVM
jgi:hypothetical protein